MLVYNASMATTKKSTTKKAVATKKAPATRKQASSRAGSSKKKIANASTVKSFRVSRPEQPFLTFAITKQTLYWIVLGIVIITFGLWINKLQSDVQAIYDSIDASMMNDTFVIEKQSKE